MVEYSDMQAGPDFGSGLRSRSGGGIYGRYLKRAFDIAAVIAAAPIWVPFVLVMAVIVSRDGGRPFYSQTRVGRNGSIFRCWKLRTMICDGDNVLKRHLETVPGAREEWDETQKLRDDPRVTPIGKILRKTSMDELPQLYNVLCGEMSLVGPRPMTPDQVSMYPGSAYFRLRPGMTGFWQISGRNSTAFATRAVHDTDYAHEVSFGTDARVLCATVGVVFKATGY